MKSVRDLILADTHLTEYYTYHGSLTTPPCSEVVTWIDFKQSIPLSHAQVCNSDLYIQKNVREHIELKDINARENAGAKRMRQG